MRVLSRLEPGGLLRFQIDTRSLTWAALEMALEASAQSFEQAFTECEGYFGGVHGMLASATAERAVHEL